MSRKCEPEKRGEMQNENFEEKTLQPDGRQLISSRPAFRAAAGYRCLEWGTRDALSLEILRLYWTPKA